jgi:hypothetical protein
MRYVYYQLIMLSIVVFGAQAMERSSLMAKEYYLGNSCWTPEERSANAGMVGVGVAPTTLMAMLTVCLCTPCVVSCGKISLSAWNKDNARSQKNEQREHQKRLVIKSKTNRKVQRSYGF